MKPICDTRPSLLGQTPEQIQAQLASFGQPPYRGRQIYKWLHLKNADSFLEMSDLPLSLRRKLEDHFRIKTLHLVSREVSRDGTEKYLWELVDGLRLESVLIPDPPRVTLCLSTQVGCALNCRFCATGRMGFSRNLSTGEMVEQVLQAQRLSGRRITNIVFMGMGEPFLNYSRVIQAAKILGDPEGLAVANKRITISTSGIVPKIYQYADERHPYGLAISLHAPNQEVRERIMPLAEKFPLDQLMAGAAYYVGQHKRRRITFEYVLLEGINDEPVHAHQLLRILSPIRCKLNLIPYNDAGLGFRAPSETRVQRFLDALLQAPFTVTVRRNRGNDISAACGQLYVKMEKRQRLCLQPLSPE